MKFSYIILATIILSLFAYNCSQNKIRTKVITLEKLVSTVTKEEILKEYNVIIYKEDKPRCGGTLLALSPFETFVLTADHCIRLNNKLPMKFTFIDIGSSKLYKTKIVKFDQRKDLALLKIIDPIPKIPVAKIAKRIPGFGETVWTLGFGGKVPDALSKGIVSKVSTKSWMGTRMMQLDITAWYGNSGGGVYNKDFELVGVISQFGPQGSGRNGWFYAVHLREITKFLQD